MTLYVRDKKTGAFLPATDAFMKRLRRDKEVRAMMEVVSQVAPTMVALASWMEALRKRGETCGSDVAVVSTFNVERVKQQAIDLTNRTLELDDA